MVFEHWTRHKSVQFVISRQISLAVLLGRSIYIYIYTTTLWISRRKRPHSPIRLASFYPPLLNLVFVYKLISKKKSCKVVATIFSILMNVLQWDCFNVLSEYVNL
ncbi:hypothetical protein EUGRSUZ_L01649 [Eucalyptus grandis]|uniref:Uncharacterized protein n=1 Tax=Eucalyptus grandis TaxID=71139 RepID=A0A058ZSJ6_EUCGR|nr:hypothetical protein EUGRSUZ_L01649 [Eucalyptus grandis]